MGVNPAPLPIGNLVAIATSGCITRWCRESAVFHCAGRLFGGLMGCWEPLSPLYSRWQVGLKEIKGSFRMVQRAISKEM